MKTGFSVTYEVFTPESAADGESAESGFIVDNVSLRHAVSALNGAAVEPSVYPFDPGYPYVWFTTIDGDIDCRTGETEYRALHMPRDLTTSTRRRIARLLGVVRLAEGAGNG